jgi:crotonobetainyl-CoA:carnitine CoA-transferase CaiB-like acyl-CoA transferase
LTSQPLAGLRVLELAQGVAGPYAGKLLADYGADVIKHEPPDGDVSRRLGPFPTDGDGQADPEQSALFLHLNTNKRSVTGDVVDDLAAWADIVIQSEPVPDPAELRRRHPKLVVVSVTPFGLTGPYAGYAGEEIVHYAFGGPMSATGAEDREPLKMGGAVGQYQCGSVAAVSALAGAVLAGRDGEGVHVDLANVETQVGSIDRRMTYLLYAAYRGQNVDRRGGYSVGAFPNGCRPTADGHIQVSTLMNWIPRMLAVVDDPDLRASFDNPEFLTDEAIHEMNDGLLLGWTLTRTSQEAMEQAQAGGWPVTAVNRPVDLLSDPHFEQRQFFVPVDHPVAGTVRQPGPPIRMDNGWRLDRPAPTLGQHSDEVAGLLSEGSAPPTVDGDADGDAADDPPSDGRDLPLSGIRILDMTVVWAGPYATCILGDLGAEVVRVDNPYVFPSATRGVLPRPPAELIEDVGGIFGGYPDADPGPRPWNRMALFNAHARNKKSVTLDLRQESGREAFLRLAETCDVMIENNSVDLLDKLGIGWDTLHRRNPRLILLRMPSVGLDGPYRNYLGFGVNFEGLCGLTAIRGYRDVDLSESETVFHMDAASGSAGAMAALMALRRRDETGVGEMIELSQSENMLNHIGELLIDAERTGAVHQPLGNRHPVHAPQGCYRCRDDSEADDAWIAISVTDDDRWLALTRAAARPDWAADPRFATAADRRHHHDELDDLLAGWTASHTPDELFAACQREGVAAAPVLHELEAFDDPHLRARAMFRPNGNDEIGVHTYPGHLWHWDGPEMAWGPLPVLGGDNDEVFRSIVGLSDDEMAELQADGHLSLDYLDPDGNPL